MSSYKRTVLFVDKVLLKSKKNSLIRGVEIFNFNLIRELISLNIDVTVPAHKSWIPIIKEHTGKLQIKIINCSFSGNSMINGVAAAFKLRKRKFHVLILANVANSLIPMVQLLNKSGIVNRCVLIAHREPSVRFVRTQSLVNTIVIAVNNKIASHFSATLFKKIEVYYGITDSDLYFPAKNDPEKNQTIKFCVLGQLDNAWKGADTAVSAFKKMPDTIRRKCQLELAAFSQPSSFSDNNIIIHKWMKIEKIPDFLRGMDVMIIPSRDEEVMRETFCQAMVQAMLTELPVIVNNLPVLMEKIDNGGGIIFKNIDELSKAMIELANNPQLRNTLGRQSRETALKRYVWETDVFVNKFLFPEHVS